MTFEEIIANYRQKQEEQNLHNEKMRAEAQQAMADAKKFHKRAIVKMGRYYKATNLMKYDVRWTTHIVNPLMEEVNRQTGLNFDLSNPHTTGLRETYSVYTHDENGHASERLTFTWNGDTLHLYTGEYEKSNCKTEEVTCFETIIENLKRNYPLLKL